MNVTFTLHHPEQKTSMLLCNISWDGLRIQIGSGMSVEPKNWDKRKGVIKRIEKKSLEKNAYLENLKNELKNYFFELKAAGKTPTKDEFKNKAKSVINPNHLNRKKKTKSFFDYFEEFIEYRKTRNKRRTIQHFQTTMTHLMNFEKKTGYKISFESINEDFQHEFSKFLSTKNGEVFNKNIRNKEKNCNNNTIATIIKNLKTFLNHCYENNIIDSNSFSRDLKVGKKAGETVSQEIALNENDLKKIENYIPKTKKLEKIKDLFIIQIYTMLRVSDLMSLKKENFDTEAKLLILHQKKTNDLIRIPIDHIMDIILKYKDFNIPSYSTQKYNDYLKELGKESGIDTPVMQTDFYGNKAVEKKFKKYELITSHTARRTGITLHLKWGMLPEELMLISGHRDRKSFERYVKAVQQEAIEDFRMKTKRLK